MSSIGAAFLADPSNSNVLRQSYVTGFLDVRGNAIIRTDASLSGNIGIGGAVSISNNIGMSGVINQLISVPLQGGYIYQQVNSGDALAAIAQVAALTTLVVNGNAVASPALAPYSNPISGNVVTLGTASVNARLGGISNYVMGNLAVLSDVSLNTRLFLGSDASFGGKLSVSSDASFGGRISVGGDISVNGLSLGLGSQSIRTNTVFGNTALQKIQTSGAAGWINNTAVGYQSLLAATTPVNNTAVGSMSLAANTTGANNTAVGYGAGAFVSTGGNITCLGYNTGFSSGATQYNNSTALGYNATITGSNQVVLGTAAESVIATGKLSIGDGALTSMNSGRIFNLVGTNAVVSVVRNSTSSPSVELKQFDPTGTTLQSWWDFYNGSTDYFCLRVRTPAAPFSENALNVITCLSNGFVGIGKSPEYKLDVSGTGRFTGDVNINGLTIGKGAGSIATNTAHGVNALNANTTGPSNTAIGFNSLINNTSGDSNTGVGISTLQNNTTTYQNTAIGYQAGLNNKQSASHWNTFLGSMADLDSSANAWTKSTAIGYQAKITASNQVVLGTAADKVFLAGGYLYGAGLITDTATIDTLTIPNYGITWQTNTSFEAGTPTGFISGYGGLRFQTLGQTRFAIKSTGNVGIGTTTPQFTLDVAGKAQFSSDVSINGNLVVNGNLSVLKVNNQYIINQTTTNYQLIVSEDISLNGRLYVSGNVGIGKTSPGSQLDVSGTILVSGYNPKNIALLTQAVPTTGAALMVDAAAGNGANRLGLSAGNYLPIISTSHVNGNGSHLNIYAYRWASSNDWFTSSTRIGQTIDVTNMAYIEFNPPSQPNGLGLYTAAQQVLTPASYSGLTIANGGNTGFNNPQPMYRLDVNGTSRLNNSLAFTGAVTGTISPNTTGATGATWAVGGITYVASASTFSTIAYLAFDTVNTVNNKWMGGGGTNPNYIYSTTTGLATSFAPTTLVVGQTDICGEWIQIQNSQQLVLNNYNIACSDITARSPKSFWIVGSNDNGTFFPIQYCTIATNPYTANAALAGTIFADRTGTQNGYTTTTNPSYSGNAYYYHRMLITATFNDTITPGSVALGDWIINYNKPSTVTLALDGTTSGQMNITGGLATVGNIGIGTTNPVSTLDVSGTVSLSTGTASNTYKNLYGKAPPTNVYLSSFSPNTTLATSSSWVNNNITWTSSASSTFSARTTYGSFDTSFANQGWGTQNPTYLSTSPFSYSPGAYTAYSTYVNSVGTVSGEWLQISSSVPVIMNSFKITNTNTGDVPSSYSICGSNDNTSWYPIMDVSYTSWAYTASTSSNYNYDLNGLTFAIQSGTITNGSISSTGTVITAKYNSYGNSANSYSYFRFIFKNLLGTSFSSGYPVDGYLWFQELTPNFSVATQPGPSRALLYMDASNINQLDVSGSLGLINSNASTMTVIPNTTGVALGGWQNNNVTWVASGSTTNASPQSPFNGFSAAGSGNLVGYQALNGSYTNGVYSGSIGNTYNVNQNGSIIGISGEWLQIQSSVPLVMKNYSIGTIGYTLTSLLTRIPGVYTIVGSNDGNNWFVIQDASFTTAPTSTATSTTSLSTAIYSVSTIAPATGTFASTQQSNNSSITYSAASKSYTYFRLIAKRTLYALALSGVVQETANNLYFIWTPYFSPAASSVSMALDNGLPNQLNVGGAMNVAGAMNVGGTLNLANGITPIYSTPSFTSAQVGYSFTTYGNNTAANSSAYSVFTNGITVSAGVWLITYNFYGSNQNGFVNIMIANNSSFTNASFITTGNNNNTTYLQMYAGSYVVTAPGTTTYYIRMESNGSNGISNNSYTWATFTRIA